MKKGFFPRLALTGMKKNGKLYIPYILTCIGMVMMFYIIASLVYCPLLDHMGGGGTSRIALSFGRGVIAVFSLIFLFYTNSFLIRRRKTEFGLYNILGMGKRNIGRILAYETLMLYFTSVIIGLGAGIALSKFAELGLANILREKTDFTLSLSPRAMGETAVVFAVIFVLILLNSLRQIHFSNPLSLLHSENAGEKPPRSNIIIAVLGLALLGGAYYLAVTIQHPVAALGVFFIAVLMVIVATYMLLIAGSVVFCRLLQKNKGYYYKPNHFVSVSSMVYRMKRNGAGLASICILITMVLVMISSTSSLYFGTEDSLATRYPRDISGVVQLNDVNDPDAAPAIKKVFADTLAANSIKAENDYVYHSVTFFTVPYKNGYADTSVLSLEDYDPSDLDEIFSVFIIPIEDYNALYGTNETLASDETLIYSTRSNGDDADVITIGDCRPLRVKRVLDDFVGNGTSAMRLTGSLFMFVSDLESYTEPLMSLKDSEGVNAVALAYYYGFDLPEGTTDELNFAVQSGIFTALHDLSGDGGVIGAHSCESAAVARNDFYDGYGGLFFLGIMLSIVFIFAAVLIIYYKQVSEGYEDKSRFEIMQNVGMTRRDIRRSINSQVLTVFFAPLVFAGLHLAFAFPLLWKMLQLFNLSNITLLIMVTIASFAAFAIFYAIIYRVTSNSYYNIVSDGKRE